MSEQEHGASVVEQELQTIIFYLTAFGYIDGNFDARERDYIRQFIDRLVAYRARLALKDADATLRAELTGKWIAHFQEVFDRVEQTVQGYFTESVADGEETREFVFAKLKLGCYELFKRFSPDNQQKLLLLADELTQADGSVHPNEVKFRQELSELLAEGAPEVELVEEEAPAGSVQIDPAKVIVPRVNDYEFFQAFERNYASEPDQFAAQARADLTVIEKTMARWDEQRALGRGKLEGKQTVADLAPGDRFLDGHVYALKPEAGREYELLVLGDLHGCYSCLKAALMQSDFFAKVDAHHLDPANKPAMKLVLLGDYIDRGRYSYNGILRTVMQLFLTVPEHVYILRGNHEYYVELNGRIFGGVKPAEAIESLQGVADREVFARYKTLFEAMPCSLLFDRTLFVHAGIPREDTLAEKFKGLSSLNDPEVRFQMLWSDPSDADVIPLELQKENARFPFGRSQFKKFMAGIGCTAMLRGHERVVEGIRPVYEDPEATLITLFSAGGRTNMDLPEKSNYRQVTPMALTIRHKDGVSQFTPFVIDYERYNKPEYNGFVREKLAAAGM